VQAQVRFPGVDLLLQTYPYYAHILARLDPLHDPSVPTLAVSAHGPRFFLHLNLDYVAQHHDRLLGLMLHEVHHIVLGHLTDPRLRAVAHPDLMELAMEMSANEFVAEPLPGRPVLAEDFGHLGIRPRQSTLERYERLVAARLAGELPPRLTPATVDCHHLMGVGMGPGDGLQQPPGDHARLRQLLEEAVEEARRNHPDRTMPLGLLAGKEPGNVLEELDELPAPRTYMDWRTALQLFVARVRAPVHTYTRPNRRAPHLVGVVPGRMWYPVESGKPRLLVAVDTSMSMSRDELAEIAAHLRLVHGLATLTVAECDVRVQRAYPFDGRLGSVAGRGGTDLRPVFEPAFLREHRPDGVVYFTDGHGPYPERAPGIKTLWVLTEPWAFGCPWGEKAALRWPDGLKRAR
jgi:predicted metal-dependent peptidase